MQPFAFPLLSDQNIAPDVMEGLRARGADVAGVSGRGHAGWAATGARGGMAVG
jgi:hypothetical protein